ncbi:MAG: sulfatase [Candidatus Omnitrophica bacterium]|nr:sulfatase [Candidatus Omnitrophota bacterium]
MKFKIIVLFLLLLFGNTPRIRPSQPKRLNVILITVDSLRPDHLGCYGYKRNTSPNIDRLANEGVVFTQAIAQGPATIPSLPSLFYSNYFRSGDWGKDLADVKEVDISFSNLAEILRTNGYFTVFICAHSVIPEIKAFQKGWDNLIKFKNRKPNAKIVTQKAIEFIKRSGNQPFFVWIHYMDAHAPYIVPYKYKKLFIGDKFYLPPKRVSIVNNKEGRGGIYKPLVYKGITDLSYYIAQYDAAIKYIDDQIWLIIKELFRFGLENNTLIIITADHGEAFGEHGFFLVHSYALFDEFIKVPLIIKIPSVTLGGKIIDKQVQLVDIVPTILDILKIDNNYKMEGISLLPLIFTGEGYNREYAFSTAGIMSCIRTSGWKLILYEDTQRGNSYFLFNLKKDKDELVNLMGFRNNQFEFLRQILDNCLKRVSFDFIVGNSLDRGVKERLKSLGYVQ